MVSSAKNLLLLNTVPSWVLCGASADLYFANSRAFAGKRIVSFSSLLSLARASVGTAQWADGHWSTFASGALRKTDRGLLIEEARTNLFLNSQAPVTQSITVVNGSVYTVSVYGNASVVLSGAGTGTVTQGSPKTITASTTSLVCTVSGAGGTFQNVQVELGAFATSPIPTIGATLRAADVITLQGTLLTAAKASSSIYMETNLGNGITTQARTVSMTTGFTGYTTTTNSRIFDGTNFASATLGSGSYAGLVKTAYGMSTASLTAIANGGTKASSAAGNWTWGNTIYLGSFNGVNNLNGYMCRIAFATSKGQFDGKTI